MTGRRAAVRERVATLVTEPVAECDGARFLDDIESAIDPDEALSDPIRRTLAIEAALDALEHIADPGRVMPNTMRRCAAIERFLSHTGLGPKACHRYAVRAFTGQHTRRMADARRFLAGRAQGMTPEGDDGSRPWYRDSTGDLAVWIVMNDINYHRAQRR